MPEKDLESLLYEKVLVDSNTLAALVQKVDDNHKEVMGKFASLDCSAQAIKIDRLEEDVVKIKTTHKIVASIFTLGGVGTAILNYFKGL